MAVAAKVPSVLERVASYREDLSLKLPIIDGNTREAAVFRQIEASLPEGDFIELSGADTEQILNQLDQGIPVIAQGYFRCQLGGFEFSGYADLLVRDGYEIYVREDGSAAARRTSGDSPGRNYQPWDVKNSSSGSEKYELQLAAYHRALQQVGFASDIDMGIVLGFNRGIVRYPVAAALEHLDEAIGSLARILGAASPSQLDAAFVSDWACDKESVCGKAYCTYPKLCAATRIEQDVIEQLHGLHASHGIALRNAGVTTVAGLAGFAAPPQLDGLKPEYSERYWNAAQVMVAERVHGKAIRTLISGKPSVPLENEQDLYFDVEWANPVDSDQPLVFMFGSVTASQGFEVFTTADRSGELAAFDDFLDFALAKLLVNPQMHIYHFHSPEPQQLRKLAVRYGGHRSADVEALCERMIDLRVIAMATFVPGCASYSIKDLEHYYDADEQLNRTDLVAGGADAMLQFHLYQQALATGSVDEANSIMSEIAAYNRDDCLSTKLLADWLRGLNFERAGQILYWN